MDVSQTCFGSRNIWAHLDVVNVMAFMDYELTVKHAFADLLQLPQRMVCRNLIYSVFRKINLRALHFVRVNSFWLSPHSRSPTELWQQRLVKQIGM